MCRHRPISCPSARGAGLAAGTSVIPPHKVKELLPPKLAAPDPS